MAATKRMPTRPDCIYSTVSRLVVNKIVNERFSLKEKGLIKYFGRLLLLTPTKEKSEKVFQIQASHFLRFIY